MRMFDKMVWFLHDTGFLKGEAKVRLNEPRIGPVSISMLRSRIDSFWQGGRIACQRRWG